jgi:hypothetical protein
MGAAAVIAVCGVDGRGDAGVVVRGAPSPAQRAFVSTFRREGVTLDAAPAARPWSVTLRASRYGCAGDLRPLAAADPEARGDRVEYRRALEGGAPIVEWYAGGPRGLEQGFTIATPPPCAGPIAVETAVSGLEPARVGAGAAELRDGDGRTALRYEGLFARDARGLPLPARLEVGDGRITIDVDAEGASYPLVVDPMLQTEDARLVGAEAIFGDGMGTSASISGNTAVLGAPSHPGFEGPGAAFVFVESGGAWTEQQVLTPPDGLTGDSFGNSVAISGDTLVVGAYRHTVGNAFYAGVVYVFVQSGGVWSLQQEISASKPEAEANYGWAVAISGDTILVGATEAGIAGQPIGGAGYVLTRSGVTWTEQQILTAPDAAADDKLGFAVALDGTTAVLGAATKSTGAGVAAGAAYVFVQAGGTWSLQQELTAADGAADDDFGSAVAISGDTALIGALDASPGGVMNGGAVYVEQRSGVAWALQQKLTASDEAPSDFFGSALGVAGDTAVIGASQHTVSGVSESGAAYVFSRSGTSWTQGNTLTASDRTASDFFGHAAGLSGSTAVVGAYVHASQTGEGYVYTVGPTQGSTSSSTSSGGGAGGAATSSTTSSGGGGGATSSSTTSSGGGAGGATTGATTSSTTTSSTTSSGGTTSASTTSSGTSTGGAVSQPGGCGCTTPGSAGSEGDWAAPIVGAGLLLAASRRSRRRARALTP